MLIIPGFRARSTSSFFQGKKGTKMPWERPCFANHLHIKIEVNSFWALNSTQLLNSPDVKSGSNSKSRFLWCR